MWLLGDASIEITSGYIYIYIYIPWKLVIEGVIASTRKLIYNRHIGLKTFQSVGHK